LIAEESHLRACEYLTVGCENEDRGCISRVERRSAPSSVSVSRRLTRFLDRFLADHLRDCQHGQVVCPHAGCSETPQKREMDSHLSSCPYRVVPCPNGCGETLVSREVAAHRSTVCRSESVMCPHEEASVGCSSSCRGEYRREDLQMHLDSPEYLRVETQQMSLQIRRQQEAISELQLVSVTQQQIITRLESSITQLEATVAAQVSPRFGSSQHCSFSGRLSFQTGAVDQSSGAFSLSLSSNFFLSSQENRPLRPLSLSPITQEHMEM
jgi:hypothetical protein